MEKLKRCPCCGKRFSVTLNRVDTGICVLCDMNAGGCGMSSGIFDTIGEAISAWNKRWKYKKKPCTNIGTDYADTDQFICSNCGIHLQGWYSVKIDDDNGEETHHEYTLRYCPNCGAKVKE